MCSDETVVEPLTNTMTLAVWPTPRSPGTPAVSTVYVVLVTGGVVVTGGVLVTVVVVVTACVVVTCVVVVAGVLVVVVFWPGSVQPAKASAATMVSVRTTI